MANEFDNIREQSKSYRKVQGCMHCVNESTLKEEDRRQDGKKAVGIDKVTKEKYGGLLEENIKKLVEGMKQFKYKKENVKVWLKTQNQVNVLEVIKRINRKIIGHYRYYGVSGNFKCIVKFYKYIVTALYKMLTRRSQRSYLDWTRYNKLLIKQPIHKPKLYINIW